MDAKLAEMGVHLQATERCHRMQVGFARAMGAHMGLVRHAGKPLGEEAMQGLVDARAGRLEIARDGLDVPTIEVEVDNGETALLGFGNLSVLGIESLSEWR